MGLKRLVFSFFFFSFPATLVIPFSEGGLIVCGWVGGWDISEGNDAKFASRCETSVDQKRRVSGVHSVKVPETLNASSLQLLLIRRCCLGIEWH